VSSQSPTMELRSRVRYRLSADAAFAWEGPQRHRLVGEGVTRDISVSGAFIFTRTCPPVGARVDLEIFLTPAPGSSRKSVQIKTEARVIRVEHSVGIEGFAAVSQDFTLLFDPKGRNKFSVSSAEESEGEEKEESKGGIPSASSLESLYSHMRSKEN
jgi:PilZ domain